MKITLFYLDGSDVSVSFSIEEVFRVECSRACEVLSSKIRETKGLKGSDPVTVVTFNNGGMQTFPGALCIGFA